MFSTVAIVTLLQTAVALWSVLLVPRYPLMGEVLGFINVCLPVYRSNTPTLIIYIGKRRLQGHEQRPLEHGTSPIVISRSSYQLFFQMLEFCETVNPNLSDYEGDGVSVHMNSTSTVTLSFNSGLAHAFGRFCNLEKRSNRQL